MNTELILAMSKFMPEEVLLDQLKSAIAEYETKKDKRAKDTLITSLILTTTRFATEGRSVESIAKDIEKNSEARDFYDRLTNGTEEE